MYLYIYIFYESTHAFFHSLSLARVENSISEIERKTTHLFVCFSKEEEKKRENEVELTTNREMKKNQRMTTNKSLKKKHTQIVLKFVMTDIH